MAFKNPFASNKELSSDNEKHEHDLDLGAFPASKEKRVEEKLEFPETKKDTSENSVSGIPTKKTTLSPMRVDVTQNHDETSNKLFEQLMDNEDEEEIIHTQMKESGMDKAYDNSTDDKVLDMIAKNIVTLRKKYPTGGIKASRYITTEVLMAASPDYFNKYQKDAAEGVKFVRDQLSNVDGASGDIKAAQDNPIDDALQDKAYYKVHSLASDFTRTSGWRDTHRAIIISMMCNEIIGFSRIDPLWRDRKIDEIMCNGPKDIQIEIKGELYKVPGCSFDTQKQLMDFIDRLYGAINKVVSLTTPLVKGRLHDKSRMYVTHPALAPDGPNFSIRRHPERFWAPNDFVKNNSSDAEMMAYIGNLVYKGASCLVIGGTHSGKTSMLNALTGFYKPKVRILTLEDNIEMKPNPKKYLAAALECREPASDRPDDKGIGMKELVKASSQLRPDVIIVGEITDEAAFHLCQALNTGHAGASTIHANSSELAIPRVAALIAQGGIVSMDGALEMISSGIDFIISLKHFPVDGSRRIVSVDEIGLRPTMENGRLTLPVKPLWKFKETGLDENRKVTGHWIKVGDISQERQDMRLLNIEDDLTWDELKELSSIPGQE